MQNRSSTDQWILQANTYESLLWQSNMEYRSRFWKKKKHYFKHIFIRHPSPIYKILKLWVFLINTNDLHWQKYRIAVKNKHSSYDCYSKTEYHLNNSRPYCSRCKISPRYRSFFLNQLFPLLLLCIQCISRSFHAVLLFLANSRRSYPSLNKVIRFCIPIFHCYFVFRTILFLYTQRSS